MVVSIIIFTWTGSIIKQPTKKLKDTLEHVNWGVVSTESNNKGVITYFQARCLLGAFHPPPPANYAIDFTPI